MPTLRKSLALVLADFEIEATESLRAPELEALLAYVSEPAAVTATAIDLESWQSEFIQAASLGDAKQFPSAACSWIGSGEDMRPGTWMHADPVRLEMSADGMSLQPTRNWR